MHMETNLQERQAILEARLAQLEYAVHRIEDELDEPMPKDWEDRASERQGDEMLMSLGRAEVLEIEQIRAALHRMEASTYGICLECGDPIELRRLDLLPAAATCAGCAH